MKGANRIRLRVFSLGFAIARRLPPSGHKSFPWGKQLRAAFARGLLRHCGKNVNIQQGCEITWPSRVSLGDYSGIGIRAHINGEVTIGNYVMMAPEVCILTQNHEFGDTSVPMCQQGHQPMRRVTIEDDVWIGQRAIILPGVTIGKGSIVGAGAVVAKDVPAYSIVVGNPARILRSRLKEHSLDSEENA